MEIGMGPLMSSLEKLIQMQKEVSTWFMRRVSKTGTVVYMIISHDVTSGSDIIPCNKIDKALVVYRFSGNVMTSITTLPTIFKCFNGRNEISKLSLCRMINRI